MKTTLSILDILTSPVININQGQEECCPTKIVSGAGLLDCVYKLITSLLTNPDSCLDGYVYIMHGEERIHYSFVEKPSSIMIDVSCG